MTTNEWWHDSVGYEIYIRSFADGDGDGVGDLRGIASRLDHLAWLGISVVWITPFYPSPMADHGYDVADYTDVDETFGSLADLDDVIARAHELGIRVVVDVVPNHTSSAHPWFVDARSGPDAAHRDYYLWRDPAPDGGPPNNWVSHFGGSAWTLDDASGQYWCHLFLPEQPDLNWRNPAVRDEFDRILGFWLDRGVDGFRIDVAQSMIKHADFPDLPAVEAESAAPGGGPQPDFDRFAHIYDLDQPETKEIFQRWRRLAEKHDALLLGEVYVLDHERFARYLADDDGLNLGFWFKPLHAEWDAGQLRAALQEGTRGSGVSWVTGSHDRARAATRFGGGARGRARQLALATVLMALPGVPFVYQGEELGMTDGHVPREQWADPIALRAADATHSRDGCRTPMLWEPVPGWGFTSAPEPWLPFSERHPDDTVAVQREDLDSTMHRYRALIHLRNDHEDLRRGDFVWLTDDGPFLAYRRGDHLVVANVADRASAFDLPDGSWEVAFATDRTAERRIVTGRLPLSSAAAAILRPVVTDSAR